MRTQSPAQQAANQALDTACRILGGQKVLAEALSAAGDTCTSAAISRWRRNGIPPERARDIELLCEHRWPALPEPERLELGSAPRAEALAYRFRFTRDPKGAVTGYAIRFDKPKPVRRVDRSGAKAAP